ncbi:MAG: hypothetical protein Q7I99_09225 [Acholeplasmataceae bacterium]|nr:hypothetical protein [Acholeplasmataceae bacterium]
MKKKILLIVMVFLGLFMLMSCNNTSLTDDNQDDITSESKVRSNQEIIDEIAKEIIKKFEN